MIDYEEFLHGARSEGAFSVYATLVNKTVAIPGSAIPLGILSMIGFVYPINGEAQVSHTIPNQTRGKQCSWTIVICVRMIASLGDKRQNGWGRHVVALDAFSSLRFCSSANPAARVEHCVASIGFALGPPPLPYPHMIVVVVSIISSCCTLILIVPNLCIPSNAVMDI